MFKVEDENYVYVLVSRNFKRIRKAKGLDKEDVAKKMGCTKAFLGNIESEKYYQTFSIPTVVKMSEALGVNISELFEEQ